MDFDESAEDAAFRAEVAEWFDEHANGPEAQLVRRRHGEDDGAFVERARPWQALMAEHGWAAITWPEHYGGLGRTATQAAIFSEEAGERSLPASPFVVGTGMAGPTIIAHGTERQKQRYLEPMKTGAEIWCQLFSEPGAGSDLAGLATRAVRDGDEWVIDGQKVWTTGADYADFGILLARTDPDVPKHRGITYFLIDMRQPGVEVRPLRQITGASHFNEVFLDGARVSNDDVVGEIGGGWLPAMTTLSNERAFMGGGGSGTGISELIALGQETDAASDPAFRQALAAAYSRSKVMSYTGMRVRTAADRGQNPGPAASTLKVMAAWNMKLNADLALAMTGPGGMLAATDATDGGRWEQYFLTAPSIRIAGGSDEIQRNILGERILGLPPEARVDKHVAFKDVPRSADRH